VFVDDDTRDVRMRSLDTGDVLGSFARDWLVWFVLHPFYFPQRPTSPRLRLGRAIVQRQIWTITADELEGGRFPGIDVRLLLAVERLRALRGLPRWLFIRPTARGLSSRSPP
jgi:hypothetical protein